MVDPVRPGRPSPLALPTQTATVWRLLLPTAQPSRKPQLVPVFQAMRRLDAKLRQWPSSPGRGTSNKVSSVSQAAPVLMGVGPSVVAAWPRTTVSP